MFFFYIVSYIGCTVCDIGESKLMGYGINKANIKTGLPAKKIFVYNRLILYFEGF